MADIACPNCEHSIDRHSDVGCYFWPHGADGYCICNRMPSDIATERILTPLAELADHLDEQRPRPVVKSGKFRGYSTAEPALSGGEGYGYAVTRIRALLEEVRDA